VKRRILVLAVLVALLAGAAVAIWRSTEDSGASAVERVAAGLRCPACEGETVAQSRSPVAAAMREAIAEQLAAGRSPDQVRAWFAQRYGTEILADPPQRGIGALLWILPGIVLLAGLVLAVRTLRRRSGGAERLPAPAPRSAARADPARTRRTWDLVAAGVLAMVAAVAVAGTRSGGDTPPRSAAGSASAAAAAGDTPPRSAAGSASAEAAGDAITRRIALAQSLEQQGQYGAAADIYRYAVAADPDPQLRLRLAFTLIRAGQPTEAADIARQLLAGQPSDADALLVLGLAERAAKSPSAAETLRRFLRLAPGHPAAAEIRRLLDQRSHPPTGPDE
jgi:cytochrome c-type biogenesis protein CcmH/NrfF